MESNPQVQVSVIIPVYNAGHRLRACVDSLVNQSIEEIELIFVLDCPTDGSDSVIKEYAEKYDNIVVIANEHNLNIGMSRNRGLEIAKGEYVAFCDHDDIVLSDMYKEMVNLGQQEDADVVLGVPQYTYSDSSLDETYFYPQTGDIREKLLPLIIGRDDDMSAWEFYFSHGVIWDNIYRRNFLKKNNIMFVDNNKITFEDNLFLIECLIYANKAVVHNKLVYLHTIEASNTASTDDFVKKEKIINYIHYLDSILVQNGLRDRYGRNFSRSVASYLKGCIRREYKNQGRKFRKTLELLNELREDQIMVRALRGLGHVDFLKGSRSIKSKILDSIIYKYICI